jgi:hypothetical protein
VNSLRTLPAIILLLASCEKDKPLDAPDPAPSEFTRTYGGAGDDYAQAMLLLDDGSIVMLGATSSTGNGNYDIFLLKTDKNGNELWQRTYGGAGEDLGYAIAQTADKGFIIAGTTKSFGAGQTDAYLVRTDSEGNPAWQKTFGGSGDDHAWGMTILPDGGCMLGGITNSYGAGGQDIYLLRTGPDGNMISYRTFGGPQDDGAVSICRGYNNSCMVLAGTNSFGNGNTDLYLLHVNYDCDSIYTRTFGTPEYEEPHSITRTADGNFLITGHTAGFGDPLHDMYALKITPAGTMTWQNHYGDPDGHDGGQHGISCTDGSYILCGRGHRTMSEDLYVIRTDKFGNKKWERHFGGSLTDDGLAICEDPVSFYVSGYTNTASGRDVYLIKIAK